MTRRAAAPSAAEPSARYGAAYAGMVLVDSGPLIALFNRGDRWHAPVLDWLRANPAARLLTTWPVATEVCALLARLGGHHRPLPPPPGAEPVTASAGWDDPRRSPPPSRSSRRTPRRS